MWTREEAISLCEQIEPLCPTHGCHVALTGGCLYRTGPRKDLDLIFYRIRQVPKINKAGLFQDLYQKLQIAESQTGFGWIHKATWNGNNIDMLFPEENFTDWNAYTEAQIEKMIEDDPWTIKYIPHPTERMFTIAVKKLQHPFSCLTEWFSIIPDKALTLAKVLETSR